MIRVHGRPARVRVCRVGSAERVGRAVAALIVAAFAVSMAGIPWAAAAAGVCAALLAVGAVTGWCPSLPADAGAVEENALGYPDARRRTEDA